MVRTSLLTAGLMLLACGCANLNGAPPVGSPAPETADPPTDPFWRNATVYLLMTDRFANGDPDNDGAYGRVGDGDALRSFMGGDIPGVIEKIEEGYFTELGVTAIWTTPIIEQVHQPYQEWGRSYAFHGYWPRDFTAVDQAYGTEADFARMVEVAHARGIRVIVDVILNHVGPPINQTDPAWPETWVRTTPPCDFQSFAGTVSCLIVPALQDIRTESKAPTALPAHLEEKWRAEGRYEQEIAELDAFFERTGYPRAPRYYEIKWLTDWVREYGVDGFRADTIRHVEPDAWAELKAEAERAFAEWKAANPDQVLDDRAFYMVGEVANFGVAGFKNAVPGTRAYDYGDRKVDFSDYGFDALINMGFPTHAQMATPDLFQLYAAELDGPFRGVGVLNFISSHDDPEPLDPDRTTPYGDAVKLLLAPGAAQIFYGDELSRSLNADAEGDAKMRSFMNWEAYDTPEGQAILEHWRRLATFRANHPSVGAGAHRELSRAPYVFSRTLNEGDIADTVLVALDQSSFDSIDVHGVFADGVRLRDAYAGDEVVVANGRAAFETPRSIALLEPAS